MENEGTGYAALSDARSRTLIGVPRLIPRLILCGTRLMAMLFRLSVQEYAQLDLGLQLGAAGAADYEPLFADICNQNVIHNVLISLLSVLL